MQRLLVEIVCLLVGLGALAQLMLPEHHNTEWFNYTLGEKVMRHPVAAAVLLIAWGFIVFLTVRTAIRRREPSSIRGGADETPGPDSGR